MKIKITRKYQSNTCVIGEFKVLNEKDKPLLELFSLEEDEEGLEANKDLRIPPGIYNLIRHSPSRFEASLRKLTGKEDDKMVCVYNDKVKKERCILIHAGNTHKDTQGCILLGLNKADNNESIGGSREAIKQLYNLLYKKDLSNIKLEIINSFKED